MARRNRQAGLSVAAAATWIALLCASSSCKLEPERECERADEHCVGEIAHTCSETQGSLGNGSEWVLERCASADHCRVGEYGAFCTLEPTPDPKCGGDSTSYCDGKAWVSCMDGFPVQWIACSACSADGRSCTSGVGTSCGPSAACMPGLVCDEFCEIPCSCPDDGTECASCKAFAGHAGYFWKCQDNACFSAQLRL